MHVAVSYMFYNYYENYFWKIFFLKPIRKFPSDSNPLTLWDDAIHFTKNAFGIGTVENMQKTDALAYIFILQKLYLVTRALTIT